MKQRREWDEVALGREQEWLPRLQERSLAADAQLTALREQREAHQRWVAEHAALKAEDLVRGAAIRDELQCREREHTAAMSARLRVLEASPPPYLLAALGERPDGAAAQRSWRQATLLLEEHRDAHSITDPYRPLGDTLLTPAGGALLPPLKSARTPDADGVAPSFARCELDAVLAELRRNEAEQQRRYLLEREREGPVQAIHPYPHRHHPVPHRAVDRGPSMAP